MSKINLVFIYTNYGCLATVITCLVTQRIILTNANETVENVEYKLNTVKCSVSITIYTKFEQVIEKKLGFKTLYKISEIILGEKISIDFSTVDLIYFKYEPIPSVDMVRSFSVYKNMLANEPAVI